MKIRLLKLLLKIALVFAVLGIVSVALLLRPDYAAQKAVAETRLALRAQGFKTDLTDFNFSTSPELRAREDILKATAPNRFAEPFYDHPNLMEAVGNDSAFVVWRQDSVQLPSRSGPNYIDELTWEDFREAINTNQLQVDAACAAVLSGPIRFNLNAGAGGSMLLPHLAILKNLTQTLNSRAMLNLHDGNKDAAWTNLLASTRLVTAWNVEPVEISQLVRFADMSLVFNATWQVLQADGWPDDKLARLQAEWEALDLFTNLPETMAFNRASAVLTCQLDRQNPIGSGFLTVEFAKELFLSPLAAAQDIKYVCNQIAYRNHGTYEDEKALLLFYRDREIELRNAVQAATWAQMRQLPGVSDNTFFQSKYRSLLQSRINRHQMNTALLRQGSSFLGRAAESEARRRILITAIALERYHGKHGSYPQTLTELTPEFLPNPLPDFMDGQPLRYRPTDDGHFLLYSVGLECVDHGGTMPAHDYETRFPGGATRFEAPPPADIVWPLPASMAAAAERHQEQLTALKNRTEQTENAQAVYQWGHTIRHQAAVEKLLAAAALQSTPDPIYHGHRLSEVLGSQNPSGTNRLTLREMLALKQIVTGAEPETVTFELPVRYDTLTNLGDLYLLIDPTNNDDSDEGCVVQQMDCDRADDGNCLLVWSTIYDSPGKHALQAALFPNEQLPDNPDISGPMVPFVVSNLCQFSVTSAHFDPQTGATFRARLPEMNANYTAEMLTTNGALLKTIPGSTTNAIIKVHWDLTDDHGQHLTNDEFNSVFHITLPESGRTQTLRGP